MENSVNPEHELTADSIATLLSQAQMLLEEQAQFGQYLYFTPPQEISNEKKPMTSKPEDNMTNEKPTPQNLLTMAQPSAAGDESPIQEQSLGNWQSSVTLPLLYEAIHECMACPLGATRTKFVFGSGNPNADVMIIGEAPGADEDAQGLPFVGAAGQLLTKILGAIGFSREEVYIANILKCRPPGNRTPEKAETDQCEPYLLKQIELIKPKFILAVGLTAANTLLKTTNKMGEIRGKTFDYHGVTMLVTYHPAALLRNPAWKTATWDDVKLLRRMYDEWRENG